MRELASTTNADGQLTYLAAVLTYDEVIELLTEAGLIPDGMRVFHWHAGLNELSLEFERATGNS